MNVNMPVTQLQVAMGIPLHRIPHVRALYGRAAVFRAFYTGHGVLALNFMRHKVEAVVDRLFANRSVLPSVRGAPPRSPFRSAAYVASGPSDRCVRRKRGEQACTESYCGTEIPTPMRLVGCSGAVSRARFFLPRNRQSRGPRSENFGI